MVVLTHHAPIVEGVSDPKFRGLDNPLGSGFVTDLTIAASGVDLAGMPRGRGALLKRPVHTWAFGHTHWCCDLVVGKAKEDGVRVVSNQRGYRVGLDNYTRPFDKEFVLIL